MNVCDILIKEWFNMRWVDGNENLFIEKRKMKTNETTDKMGNDDDLMSGKS